MSEKFLKGIFLVFGFCFFLETIWMIGANFGIAEPFCLVIGKNALKCMEDGQIKAVAKQFCIGKAPFGSKYKQEKSKQTDSLVPPFEQQMQQYQGYPTQNAMLQQQQQFLLQQQQLQAQRQAQAVAAAKAAQEASEEE